MTSYVLRFKVRYGYFSHSFIFYLRKKNKLKKRMILQTIYNVYKIRVIHFNNNNITQLLYNLPS